MPTREVRMGDVVIMYTEFSLQGTNIKAQQSSAKLQLDLLTKVSQQNHSDNFVVLILAHGTYPFKYYYYYYYYY
jgi:hypothetical protein